LLTDPRYSQRLLSQAKLPREVRNFWEQEMPSRERERREWVMPVVNKLGQLVKSGPLCNILGQTRNALDLRTVMEERRILIVNLSAQELGARKNKILGALLISHLLITAMARPLQTTGRPRPFFLYIDEFQHFLTNAITDIVSEAGKFGLCLTLAHQCTSQLGEKIRSAILGTVGMTIAFKLGGEDAGILEAEFGPRSQQDFGVRRDFLRLAQHQVCAKFPDDDVSMFWTCTPLWEEGSTPRQGHREQIIHWSQQAYGKPRDAVEAQIAQLWGEASA
jgi:hypothetical protein